MELAMDFTRLSHSTDGLSLIIPTIPGILNQRSDNRVQRSDGRGQRVEISGQGQGFEPPIQLPEKLTQLRI
jgi:hypothetical protein